MKSSASSPHLQGTPAAITFRGMRAIISLVFLAMIMLSAGLTFGFDWKAIRLQDRDYVSFANVAQFYQFPEYTRVSRNVSLRSDHRGLRAQAGTSELDINGVRFFTDFPILSNSDETLFLRWT